MSWYISQCSNWRKGVIASLGETLQVSPIRTKYPLGQDFSRRGNLAFTKSVFPYFVLGQSEMRTAVVPHWEYGIRL